MKERKDGASKCQANMEFRFKHIYPLFKNPLTNHNEEDANWLAGS